VLANEETLSVQASSAYRYHSALIATINTLCMFRYDQFQNRYRKKLVCLDILRGTRWSSWLRHCATHRNVAGSIPDGVTGIFH
jgi:hypothetical protein